ncbi:MAG TPA: hypothetical protein VF867_11955 [Arthrobacter sp.]
MKRRHAAYLTAIIPVAVLALIILVMDPALYGAGSSEVAARIRQDILLFGAIGLGSVFVSVFAVSGWTAPANRG